MELKEYLAIFKKHFSFFMLVAIVSAAVFVAFQFSKPFPYKASLALNITREKSQKTDDYKYDNFYRLQADEKFANTVVSWMALPRIINDICADAETESDKKFKAKLLSSQAIEIIYTAPDTETARKLSVSAVKILNRETAELNKFSENEDWFKILSSESVISANHFNLPWSIILGLLIGIFLGFWSVLIKHYLE